MSKDKKRPSRRVSGADKNAKMIGTSPTGERRGRVTERMDKDNATRMMTHKVKTARGRKISSKLWLERQLNDPYVKEAKIKGYRSRAAFKIQELDDKFNLIRPDSLICDLGAAPGGWTQIAIKRGAKRVVGIDVLPVETVAGAEIIEMDFMDETAPDVLKELLGGRPSLVMSDLAANTTGHKNTDHLKTIALVEAAANFAMDVLAKDGSFVTKVFQGGAQHELLDRLRSRFEIVKHAKPKSSRAGSPEIYLVAKHFRG
ncbi:MAG: RlmE family RNA methyltransferase [Maricaulaceae bacterium]